MKIKIILFFLFSVLYPAQHINLQKIENEVLENNRAGKHQKSQNKLLKILAEDEVTEHEQAGINLLLATTFRSINDYSSTINYLKKAQALADTSFQEDSLKMKIAAEMAFTYFDNQKYALSEKIIEKIRKKKYANLDFTDKAYIIMQEGYINFLKTNYAAAEKQFFTANKILKVHSACNQPVVLVKQMQLYSALKSYDQVEQIYRSAIRISDSCKILKYKIYATEEIKRIYEINGNEQKVYQYSKTLDSLNTIDDRENNLSEMHVVNQTFLEEETEAEKKYTLISGGIAFLLALCMLVLAIFLYKKSKTHQRDKAKFEDEIFKIKEELKQYSKTQFSNSRKENDILNSDKLNKRQKELLLLVSEGKSNKEIAEQLFVTEATVKYHLRNIYALLDIKNRKEIFGHLSH